jgi:hypothetical protein
MSDEYEELTGDAAIVASLLDGVATDEELPADDDGEPSHSRIAEWKAIEEAEVDAVQAERARKGESWAINRAAYGPDAVEVGAEKPVNIDTDGTRQYKGDPYLGASVESLMKKNDDGNPKKSNSSGALKRPPPKLSPTDRLNSHERRDLPTKAERETEAERAQRLIDENANRLSRSFGRPLKGRERRMLVACRLEPTWAIGFMQDMGKDTMVEAFAEHSRRRQNQGAA